VIAVRDGDDLASGSERERRHFDPMAIGDRPQTHRCARRKRIAVEIEFRKALGNLGWRRGRDDKAI
jgi:hypothetical protein